MHYTGVPLLGFIGKHLPANTLQKQSLAQLFSQQLCSQLLLRDQPSVQEQRADKKDVVHAHSHPQIPRLYRYTRTFMNTQYNTIEIKLPHGMKRTERRERIRGRGVEGRVHPVHHREDRSVLRSS